MSTTPSPANSRTADRLLADLQELAERIDRALPEDGGIEVQSGVHFRRNAHPTEPIYGSAPPSFCVIAQGSKQILLAEETFRYDPAHYLITTMELPLVGCVVEATPESPYLSFRLELDPALVTSVLVESGYVPAQGDGSVKAVDVSRMEAELLDATLRLVRLTESPEEYRILAPLVIREIVYRLFIGAQGNRMRHLAKVGGHAHRMARAIETIRDNFSKPLRVEAIARQLRMSVSGFHAHFKTVTAMSPLQFQKQLRLQEARRLMLAEDFDAAQAGYRVGYDDPSHFSREYKRHFGRPPIRDIEHLRERSGT